MQRPALTWQEAGECREDAASLSDSIDVLQRRLPRSVRRWLAVAILARVRRDLHRRADSRTSDFPPAYWWPESMPGE